MTENEDLPPKISPESTHDVTHVDVSNMKGRMEKFQESIHEMFKKENIKKVIQNFDVQTSLDWASNFVQKRGTAFYGTLLTVVLSTYFLSDLTALVVGELIPTSTSSKNARPEDSGGKSSLMDYNSIYSRNLFNSQGIIPGEESMSTTGANEIGGAAVKTTLPLNLIGTLIMENELLSIATIEDKGATAVYPVRVEDEVPGKLKVIKIEARRVTFINKSSGRNEYVEMPEEAGNMPKITTTKPATSPGVEKVASTQYNVSRTEVDKALSDFNNILTQARAVPNFENGVSTGYKLFQIVPGSIYDKLGLQNGDVISGLNGQPINDPGKAFEMLNELKTSSHLELQVKKDGKLQTYTYDIH